MGVVMSASEIQSKLVGAIRQIAELEEKVESCDKKSKELAGDIERRSRQIFYLERNCEQKDKEISDMKTKNFLLEAKSKKEDFEDKIDEQECAVERLQREDSALKDRLKEIKAEEAKALQNVSNYQSQIAKSCNSTNEVITMFQDEVSKAARDNVTIKDESSKQTSQLVDESAVFDMMKQHVRFLEHYRVDSIFRIFGLKAQVKVLQSQLDA